MGNFRWALALLMVLTTLTLGGAAAQAAGRTVGTVAALRGSATVQASDGAPVAQLTAREQVHEGEVVHTGPDSRLKLALRDGTTLALGADSELKLDHLALGPDSASTFTQLSGYVRAVVARVRPNAQFEIQTSSMVAAVRGTDWIQNYDSGATRIYVARGRVQASGTKSYAGDQVVLTAGQGVTFSDKAHPTPVVRWKKPEIDLFVAATRVP